MAEWHEGCARRLTSPKEGTAAAKVIRPLVEVEPVIFRVRSVDDLRMPSGCV
jgi:hypothetical protein